MSRGLVDRLVVACTVAVVLYALAGRVHDVAAYPALYDYDAGGHAVNVLELAEGRLPNLRSWGGSHPPLYYAVGAALWRLLPDGIPVHVTLRCLAVAGWLGTVWIVWRTLRRLGFGIDAGVVAALFLGAPGLVIASSMMTNDALCALFVTAALARLVDVPRAPAPSAAHAAVTGMLAGLAALTKATGAVAVAATVAFYAWRSWREPATALRNVVAAGLVGGAFAAVHYVRLFLAIHGSPYLILGTRAGSIEKEAIGAIVYAVAPTRWKYTSRTALFHDALWGDPLQTYLPTTDTALGIAVSCGGLLVAALFVAGLVRLLRQRAVARRTGAVLAFGVLYAGVLFPLVWIGAWMVLTKINYLLPAALPLAIVLAAGIAWPTGAVRSLTRMTVLAVAAGGVALTWYGWWEPAAAAAPPAATARASDDDGTAPGAAVATVERYFALRARDPIRAASMLSPEVHLAHGLREAKLLGVILKPEVGLAPDEARDLEIARGRTAWLDLYNLVRWMQPVAAALAVRPVVVNQEGDTADVTVRVSAATPAPPPGAIGEWPFPPFEQRFTLRRLAGVWRITAVEQHALVAENAVASFVADPTFEGFKGLRALGWKPSWEDAFAAALPRPD